MQLGSAEYEYNNEDEYILEYRDDDLERERFPKAYYMNHANSQFRKDYHYRLNQYLCYIQQNQPNSKYALYGINNLNIRRRPDSIVINDEGKPLKTPG